MTEMILDNTFLILLLPLWIFMIIMFGRFFAVYVNKRITYTLTCLSSFLGILLCSLSLLHFEKPLETSFDFIRINNFTIPIGLYVDKLSLIIALTLFLISFAVQIYSISFMKNEKKNYRFFALLNLFNFSMAGLLFSNNLFQLYVFWELVGIISYLLIGFDYDKQEKSEASRRVFLTNRIGDTALLGGIIMSSYFMYNYTNNYDFASLMISKIDLMSAFLPIYASPLVFNIICLLFIIAAIVKSAQFPFYTWLQDAMEAKLPVSALLHSATLVTAGVYLIMRLLPLFQTEGILLLTIAGFGILTAIICSTLASIERNPKKILAYSTSANFGLIFLALGFSNILAGLIFLISHAFIKSMLFLTLPYEEKNPNCFEYGLFIIGSFSLAGIIFAGFSMKEILYMSVNNEMFRILYNVVSLLSAFYISRLCILLFKNNKITKNLYKLEFLSSLFLLFINVCIYMILRKTFDYSLSTPYLMGFLGIASAFILHKNSDKGETPKVLEKIYNRGLVYCYNKVAQICDFVDTKVLGNYTLITNTAKKSVQFVEWIEKNIMEKAVKNTSGIIKKISEYDFRLQKRNVQIYNAYALIIITIILSGIIVLINKMQ